MDPYLLSVVLKQINNHNGSCTLLAILEPEQVNLRRLISPPMLPYFRVSLMALSWCCICGDRLMFRRMSLSAG